MRIAYVAKKHFPSRMANSVQIISMCEGFASHDATVHLIAFRSREYKNESDLFRRYGVERQFGLRLLKPRGGSLRRQIRLVREARRGRYDLYYTRSLLIASWLAYTGNTRVVYELHDFAKPWYFKLLVWLLARRALITAISHRLTMECARLGITAHYLPDGVKCSSFGQVSKKAARRKLGLPLTKHIVLYTGTFQPAKGLHTLISAIALLPKELKKKTCCVIIGGKHAGEKEALARRCDVTQPELRFEGFQEHARIPLYLAAADILVIPNSGKTTTTAHRIARLYTSPLKLFEYMAAERPIIASAVPAIKEVLTAEDAFLVKPDDPNALARGIEQLLSNKELARELALASKKKSTLYDWAWRAKNILEEATKSFF